MKSCALASRAAASSSCLRRHRACRAADSPRPCRGTDRCPGARPRSSGAPPRDRACAGRARRSAPLPACGSNRRSSSRAIEDLPEPLGPTMPIFSPARDGEGEPVMRGAAAAGIGETDILEGDGRGQRRRSPRASSAGCGGTSGSAAKQRVDAGGGRLPDHALVQHRAQVAQRAEHLGAGHQHDQQRLDAHQPVRHPPDAERQAPRRRRSRRPHR